MKLLDVVVPLACGEGPVPVRVRARGPGVLRVGARRRFVLLRLDRVFFVDGDVVVVRAGADERVHHVARVRAPLPAAAPRSLVHAPRASPPVPRLDLPALVVDLGEAT